MFYTGKYRILLPSIVSYYRLSYLTTVSEKGERLYCTVHCIQCLPEVGYSDTCQYRTHPLSNNNNNTNTNTKSTTKNSVVDKKSLQDRSTRVTLANIGAIYALYSICYALYAMQYMLCNICYMLYSILYTLYSILCTLYSVLYTPYSICYMPSHESLPYLLRASTSAPLLIMYSPRVSA